MTPEEQETLRRLFWLPDDSQDRLACDVLYALAKGCPAKTEIILLGASTGLAAICLAMGAGGWDMKHVFCIDEEPENPDFIANTVQAHVRGRVTWVQEKFRKAAKQFGLPGAGVVVWDTGRGPDLLKDFAAWQDKVVDGGVFAVHANRAAWPMLVDYAVAGGMWVKGMVHKEAGIGTLRKWEL